MKVFQFNIDFEKSSSVSQRNLASFYHRFHCGCSSNMCGCELYAVCPNQMLQTNSYSVVDGATVSKLIQILALDFIYNIIKDISYYSYAIIYSINIQFSEPENVFKGTRNVPSITH